METLIVENNNNKFNSLIKIYNKNTNTILHVIISNDKKYLENYIHIYYCLINFIIPMLKDDIDNEEDKLNNNYLIKLGIKNNLIDYDIKVNNNENIDVCIFDTYKVDEIIKKIEEIHLKITNEKIKKIINIELNTNNIVEYNIKNDIKNTCMYCNKKFKNLGSIPKHEDKCRTRK